MILWLLVGAAVLFLLLGGMRAFERASVPDMKTLGAWVVALGGLSLAFMLILTGRGLIGLAVLVLAAPVLWDRVRASGGLARMALPRRPRRSGH